VLSGSWAQESDSWRSSQGAAIRAFVQQRLKYLAVPTLDCKEDNDMKKLAFRFCVPSLAIFALTLLAAPGFAQVPQHMTYTGRLVDNLGVPLAGPVNQLDLQIFDAEVGGSLIFVEAHFVVDLDATGAFSVQLGQGSHLNPLDAGDFSGVDRWLEVVVDGETLTPRQKIGSVPWALIAQQANEVVRDPAAPRFEDCGDGTVADHQTGLQWEKKTGALGSGVYCETAGCPDPHIVKNRYEWSNTGTEPDGGAFTDFLAKLNNPVFGAAASPSNVTGCFAGHCDWRLPNIVELETILDCANSPCIDPIFGDTVSAPHWSASTLAGDPGRAWDAYFDSGYVSFWSKTYASYVRAVRAGSCN
jgi:hypothetical protein